MPRRPIDLEELTYRCHQVVTVIDIVSILKLARLNRLRRRSPERINHDTHLFVVSFGTPSPTGTSP
ncbi:hypothetical protein RDI58_027115 [Solanum bulbocastanum]|uniref:Uncharacterized protein n=1 Tax=Solanum bulbocastanum TaxID=147425 RepID=A0AAN8SVF5_SOLBU